MSKQTYTRAEVLSLIAELGLGAPKTTRPRKARKARKAQPRKAEPKPAQERKPFVYTEEFIAARKAAGVVWAYAEPKPGQTREEFREQNQRAFRSGAAINPAFIAQRNQQA